MTVHVHVHFHPCIQTFHNLQAFYMHAWAYCGIQEMLGTFVNVYYYTSCSGFSIPRSEKKGSYTQMKFKYIHVHVYMYVATCMYCVVTNIIVKNLYNHVYTYTCTCTCTCFSTAGCGFPKLTEEVLEIGCRGGLFFIH